MAEFVQPMNRRVVRSYFFTDNEVNSALIDMLKAKDIPAPDYVGNAGTTKWTKEPNGIRVEWIAEDKVEV